MPRVHFPPAACIASTESQLLPFLAPRAFTECSSLGNGAAPQHGKSNGIQNEAKGLAGQKRRSRSQESGTEHPIRTPYKQSSILPHQPWTQRTTVTASLSYSQVNSPRAINGAAKVDQLYADIFYIARQQARTYATTANMVYEEPTCTPQAEDPSTEPVSSQRSKAATVERRRLENYLARYLPRYQSPWNKHLLKRGQYRSLRRRILNIEQWDIEEIDMSQLDGTEDKDWRIQAFAALDRSVFDHVARYTRKIRIHHHPKCAQWMLLLLQDVTAADLLRLSANWHNFDLDLRKSIWKGLLVYLLDHKPSRALDFMRVLTRDPQLKYPFLFDPGVFADALGHLSKLHINRQYTADPDWNIDPEMNRLEFAPGFYDVFRRVLARHPSICPEELLYNVAQFTEIQDLRKLFDLFVDEKVNFGFDTLLHYARSFAEAGDIDYALRCLAMLQARWKHHWKDIVERQRFRWICALILRKTASSGSGYRATPDLVKWYIDMGVKMDIAIYNVVIHNAMEAGDYNTAFKIFNSLEAHDIKPDGHTLGILLHGCTLLDNPAMFGDFAKHCKNVARETHDAWLATEYLHYLYVRHQDSAEVEEFLTGMWRAYLKLFEPSALEPFVSLQRRHLRARIAKSGTEPDMPLMRPTPMALYLILQVEIKYAMSLGNQNVVTLYDQFKVLAFKKTHPTLVELADQPIIWNAFLLAFCKKQQFGNASDLLRDMTNASPQPNIFSWNIFMRAFFQTGQMQAGERAYEIMRTRGIEPEPYTYGILLKAYARAQLLHRIAAIMPHLDSEQELDPELLQALSQVADRQAMVRVLDEARVAKEAESKRQADWEADRREERWSAVSDYGYEYADVDREVDIAAAREVAAIRDVDKEINQVERQVKAQQQQFFIPGVTNGESKKQ